MDGWKIYAGNLDILSRHQSRKIDGTTEASEVLFKQHDVIHEKNNCNLAIFLKHQRPGQSSNSLTLKKTYKSVYHCDKRLISHLVLTVTYTFTFRDGCHCVPQNKPVKEGLQSEDTVNLLTWKTTWNRFMCSSHY